MMSRHQTDDVRDRDGATGERRGPGRLRRQILEAGVGGQENEALSNGDSRGSGRYRQQARTRRYGQQGRLASGRLRTMA